MRITILHGGCFPVPPLLGGAVEKIWFALAKEFAARGHRVVQVSRTYEGLPERENKDGVEHRRLRGYSRPASFNALFLHELAFSFRALSNLPPADIIVPHSITAPLFIRKKRFGRLYVHVARFPKGQMRWYSHARRLQAVSQAVAKAICDQAPELRSKVTVIANPHCQEPYAHVRDSVKRERTILFTGRVHPEKGVHLLVEAFAGLPDTLRDSWNLKIVGPWQTEMGGGGEGYRQQLQTLAEPCRSRISFAGMIGDPVDLAREYAKAALFVYPSLAEKGESFGLAPLEAAFYGCPLILSDLSCFDDFFIDGAHGWQFRRDDPGGLRNTLCQALSESSERENRARMAQSMTAPFDLTKIARSYLDDFQSLLDE